MDHFLSVALKHANCNKMQERVLAIRKETFYVEIKFWQVYRASEVILMICDKDIGSLRFVKSVLGSSTLIMIFFQMQVDGLQESNREGLKVCGLDVSYMRLDILQSKALNRKPGSLSLSFTSAGND